MADRLSESFILTNKIESLQVDTRMEFGRDRGEGFDGEVTATHDLIQQALVPLYWVDLVYMGHNNNN